MDKIIIKGARENNLKNINLELPKNKFIVITGVSGSGKSSLAFDTIYAEGERKYLESLSSYARQFLGGSQKPNVDSIEGLSPAISIDQKSTNNNPRSTVGTITELYDLYRLLFARVGIPYCPTHKVPITSQTIEEMTNKVMEFEEGAKIKVLSPIIEGKKGTHKELLDELRSDGYVRVNIDNEEYDLSEEINISKTKKHNIKVIIDRLIIKPDIRGRLYSSLEEATKLSKGKVLIDDGKEEKVFSENFACPYCEFSLSELEPRIFSFNSPYGACEECKGLGVKKKINKDLIIPDKSISLEDGAIVTYGKDKNGIDYQKLRTFAKYKKIDLTKPVKELSEKELHLILYGSDDILEFTYYSKTGSVANRKGTFEGAINNLERRYLETKSNWIRNWLEEYMMENECPVCKGARLKEEVLSVLINGKNIYELTKMSVRDTLLFFENLKFTKEKEEISKQLIKEIKERLSFLQNVGLDYLTLDRKAGTLSGGEAQRIRLATQIGTRLTGVLYVLDEPSIGLHQKDNDKLINAMIAMRDLGNTIIVVEHDIETMKKCDYLVDVGPLAGEQGGEIVSKGTPSQVANDKNSITGQYLSGKKCIEVPKKRRKGNGNYLKVKKASQNNLKNISVNIPLGTFNCVTGVSGSGKSTLVDEVIYKTLKKEIYKTKIVPGKHEKIEGIENIDKVVYISQSPIGRTPRSNPATYTGVFDDIRDVFAATKESREKGYSKGRFSFNVKGGRCEACRGDGVKKIEMHFLPDVYVPCEVCQGTKYNNEVLKIKYKEKNIHEVLEMRVNEALKFFENHPKIISKLQVLQDVGLGYIKLGQSAPTLSGGEASRIKLAKELQKKPTGKTIFIMDEPTIGLHSYDVEKLLAIINKIVDNGDSVLIIEHNLDMIKMADYIIDLGPDGGDKGGNIIDACTPEKLIKNPKSYTGEYLKELL